MPPKPVVRMAGGRRVAKGRRTGPSAEKAKLYRQDDKERLKKAAKKDKGGLRNDNSSETAAVLCKGLGIVVGLTLLLFVAAKNVSYTPQEVRVLACHHLLSHLYLPRICVEALFFFFFFVLFFPPPFLHRYL